MTIPSTPASRMLESAIRKTDKVQDELQDAAGALADSNAVLSSPLSTAQAVAAVAGAVKQNTAVESQVQDAAQELEAVKDLIQEAQVAQASAATARNSGAGTASILGYFEGRRAQAREEDAKRDAS